MFLKLLSESQKVLIIHKELQKALNHVRDLDNEKPFIAGWGSWGISSKSSPEWNVSGEGYISVYNTQLTINEILNNKSKELDIILPKDLEAYGFKD